LEKEENEISKNILENSKVFKVEAELQNLKDQLEKFNEEETKILQALSSHDAKSKESS